LEPSLTSVDENGGAAVSTEHELDELLECHLKRVAGSEKAEAVLKALRVGASH
jgi:hypothetical protein